MKKYLLIFMMAVSLHYLYDKNNIRNNDISKINQ